MLRDYPWNSTYAFAENDVIRSIDLDGGERKITNVVNINPTATITPGQTRSEDPKTESLPVGNQGKDWYFIEQNTFSNQSGDWNFKWYSTNAGVYYINQSNPICKTTTFVDVKKIVNYVIPGDPEKFHYNKGVTNGLPFAGVMTFQSNTVQQTINAGVDVVKYEMMEVPIGAQIASINMRIKPGNNTVDDGIISGLKKKYGVDVNVTYDNKMTTSNYEFSVNWQQKIVDKAATPDTIGTKEVTTKEPKEICVPCNQVDNKESN